MANDVTVVIELSKGSPRVGFGYPLIFAGAQGNTVPYTEVGSLEEIVKAGFENTSEVYNAARLVFMQSNAPTKLAVCASTENTVAALPSVLKEGWRQLIVVSDGVEGESAINEIAAYIEDCGKHAVYFAAVNSENTNVLTALAGFKRTVAVVYDSVDTTFPEAAVVGATAGYEAGSITYKNMILKGVTAQDFTDAEIEAIHDKNAITILKKAGDIVTSEGICSSGEYVDIIDSMDYILEQIEFQSQSLLNRVGKLSYDNTGISQLEAVVVSVLKDAANNGMIAINDEGDYDYTVNFLPRSECSPADVSTRHYSGGNFSFVLAGAIHTARINGTISA